MNAKQSRSAKTLRSWCDKRCFVITLYHNEFGLITAYNWYNLIIALANIVAFAIEAGCPFRLALL